MTALANRTVIYARFSSDKQSERSIDDQVALCRAYCERNELSVVGVYDDRAISGASTVNRLGWEKLMRDARGGKFDVVVAEALDRISRDQEDLAGIYKRLRFMEIEIRTVQDGKAEEIHVGVKGLVGALYLKDLAQKTKRGQAGVVRDGRHNGGRSYGYRPIAGENGRLEILEDEAAVVRRIFESYITGKSPRDIAACLNKEGIPGPKGGPWNASTIAGSRKRANGILQNALYVGRIIWNRQSFIKDPETGRRISRPNPKSEWMTSDAPELRIVADELFDNVEKRRAERAGSAERHYASRPRRLLSGLLKCGCCGSGYVISGADKRGPYLRCSRMVETGLCGNRCTVGVDLLEKRVLEGLEKQLASPDLIAEYVREYHRAWTTLRDSATSRRAQLQKELRDIESDTKTTIKMLMATKNKALLTHLDDLEKRQEALEAELVDVAPPLIELHPNVGDIYRKKVRDLKAYLAATDDDNRADAYRAIRELIEKVVIIPKGGAYKGCDIEIYGHLAALLEASQRGTMREPKSMGALVAGVGFEPTTFRL
jgi:site-specific DNA recombinase